ncbi:MAG TPA: hypothetical protein VHD56_09855 [Tepidisphaeraceae bacterium]|nr:hypothetical protein [Tepidisphaeraceae bacterium]
MTVLNRDQSINQRDVFAASGLAKTLLLVVAIRAVVFVAGALANYNTIPPRQPADFPPLLWTAWDGQHYVYILQNGYPADVSHPAFYKIAFFPGYPLAGRVLATVMPPHIALVAISNACSLIGFAFFYMWVLELAGRRTAVIGVLILATSASAVFFCAALTEGPFFMFVSVTLWLIQRKRLYAAAVVCALATFTRPTGAALAGTLGMHALLHGPGPTWTRRFVHSFLIGLIASAGGFAYWGFLTTRFHDPKVFTKAEDHWQTLDSARVERGKQTGEPERYSKQFFIDRLSKPQAWNYGIAAIVLILTLAGFVIPGPVPKVLFLLPLAIFIMTALPNHGLRVSSVVRYESASIPLFCAIGWWLSKLRRSGVVLVLLVLQMSLQVYYAVMFCRWIWVG